MNAMKTKVKRITFNCNNVYCSNCIVNDEKNYNKCQKSQEMIGIDSVHKGDKITITLERKGAKHG
jgi:hypothetical protein